MKVAICSDGVFPSTVGGIQRHTRLLVETLAREHSGIEIVVVHPHADQSLFGGLPTVTELVVAPRPGRRRYAAECLSLSWRMAAAVASIPDALVYAQGLAGWAGHSTRDDLLIVNPHGLEPFQCRGLVERAKTWPLRIGLKRSFGRARKVISLGGKLTDILRRHVPDPDRRIVTIPNGVQLPEVLSAPRSRDDGILRLLFVGRFAGNKGIPDLLAAMRILADRGLGDRVTLDLVGSGPLWSTLTSKPTPAGIRYHGAVTDAELDRLYAVADVFVLPTLFEGMPTVVLEAMVRGLPIIVTDVGATRELVDASNGFLVSPRRPLELAARVEQCLRMPREQFHRLGSGSVEKATTRFSWSEVARQHVAMFAEVEADWRASTRRGNRTR